MRERFSNGLAPEIQAHLFEPALRDDLDHYFEAIRQINEAHLVMLTEQRIITADVAAKLAQALVTFRQLPKEQLPLSAEKEDLYFNIESFLIAQAGMELAGQLHTGRSRNDLYATASRLKVRSVFLDLCAQIQDLITSLLSVAKREANTVAPGYTHMQAAEPITIGHYLSGVAEALERDFSRLLDAYPRLNLCPLGACAMAGTSFPIDRDRVAALLGFDGLLENSIDAVASRDYLAEILADLAMLMTDLSRLAQDLYIWATDEFHSVEIADSVAACSSIMPQKKNPVTLEHIKAKGSHVNGALVSVLTALKGTPFTHCRDVSSETFRLFWPAVTEVERALALMRLTISTLNFNHDVLRQRTEEDFTTVTELANSLVRQLGLTFREAHGLVGGLVRVLVAEGLDARQITADRLEVALRDFGIYPPQEQLQALVTESLEPLANVQAKQSLGSPAPDMVQRVIANLDARVGAHQEHLEAKMDAISYAQGDLERQVLEMANSHS